MGFGDLEGVWEVHAFMEQAECPWDSLMYLVFHLRANSCA